MVELTISQAALKQRARRSFFSLQHCTIRDEAFPDTIKLKGANPLFVVLSMPNCMFVVGLGCLKFT